MAGKYYYKNFSFLSALAVQADESRRFRIFDFGDVLISSFDQFGVVLCAETEDFVGMIGGIVEESSNFVELVCCHEYYYKIFSF